LKTSGSTIEEELLAACGIIVSHETVRQWTRKTDHTKAEREAKIQFPLGCAWRPAYISRMTRSGDRRSSNKEAVRHGEATPRMVEIPPQRRPAPTQKPKERPASKGRVHMGRTRN
jgi:hypothetical protein